MVPLEWHKEQWIKKASRQDFIAWCAEFQNQLPGKPNPDEAALIYDSHVMPKETIAAIKTVIEEKEKEIEEIKTENEEED